MATSPFYKEARELIPACFQFKSRLSPEERAFIEGLQEKLTRYQEGLFISEKQIVWLRAIAKKAPDPRQPNMF